MSPKPIFGERKTNRRPLSVASLDVLVGCTVVKARMGSKHPELVLRPDDGHSRNMRVTLEGLECAVIDEIYVTLNPKRNH